MIRLQKDSADLENSCHLSLPVMSEIATQQIAGRTLAITTAKPQQRIVPSDQFANDNRCLIDTPGFRRAMMSPRQLHSSGDVVVLMIDTLASVISAAEQQIIEQAEKMTNDYPCAQ